MGETITFEWENLPMFFEDVEEVGVQVTELETYFNDQVCNKSGFAYDTCALKPLADMMDTMVGHFSTVVTTFEQRYVDFAQAVAVSAKRFDLMDGAAQYNFQKMIKDNDLTVDGIGEAVDWGQKGPGLNVRGISVKDVAAHLDEPEGMKKQFPKEHDKKFQDVSAGWDALRDDINVCIDWCRDKGIDFVERLPNTSLEEYIVFPLSGNYYRIQANGIAAQSFSKALETWAGNFALLAAKGTAVMRGAAGTALYQHTMLYSSVTLLISGVMKGLAKVFASIAKLSEKLAIRVEKMIRVLGEKLLKLSKFILKRINAAVLIFTTLKDLAEKGTDFFKEVIDDVKTTVKIIALAFDLADDVKTWAQTEADRLATISQISDMIKQLPQARGSVSFDKLMQTDTADIKKQLNSLKEDFGDPDGEAWNDLEKKLDSAVEESGANDKNFWEHVMDHFHADVNQAMQDAALANGTPANANIAGPKLPKRHDRESGAQ